MRGQLCPMCGHRAPEDVKPCPYCNTMPALPARRVAAGGEVLPEGAHLGGYRLGTLIGEGGAAHVYAAFNESTGQRVALKVLKRMLGTNVQRFAREARTMARLKHPNIVRLIEAGVDEGALFLAMEYVSGGSLADKVAREGPLSVADCVPVICQIADALCYVWRRRLAHRDIKPANILLTAEGCAKLADLGLVRLLDEHPSLTPSGLAIGSPCYMSPEQTVASKGVDIRTDVYSLGIAWFVCLTARVPFGGKGFVDIAQAIRHEPLPDLRALKPELPVWVCECIARMSAKAPDERFADPQKLLQFIAEAEGRGGVARS